jgi:AcrR family transcriptional regulator
MLCDGLAALMREKEFAAITVTDLVEAAKVGRTTFYRHFDEIEDILRMRNDQVSQGLADYLQAYRRKYAHESGTNVLKPVLRYFYLHSEIVELLLMADRIDIFQESIRRLLEPHKPMLAARYEVEEDYVDYIIALRAGAITNILTRWIETGKKQAPDELADKIGAMVSNRLTVGQLL